jgi:microcystin-dependent protein
MSQPYVGQIVAVGFNWAPVNWLLCNGQTYPIQQYEVLYTLIGTTYGGDGQTTFGVPNLNGRAALGFGQGTGLSNYNLGQAAGSEGVTLTVAQMGAHSHVINGTTATATTLNSPAQGGAFAQASASVNHIYGTGAMTTLLPSTISNAQGGAQQHENRQPFQVLNYIIAFNGLFPPHP